MYSQDLLCATHAICREPYEIIIAYSIWTDKKEGRYYRLSTGGLASSEQLPPTPSASESLRDTKLARLRELLSQ